MKTLYLSDLDGTLLRSNERLSAYTIETINEFVKRGGCFSYATARSLVTASVVTEGLNTEFPVICYNGGFIFGNESKEILLAQYFSREETEQIAKKMAEHNYLPIVYSFINGTEHFSFTDRNVSPGVQDFLDKRKNDRRRRKVQTEEELYQGNVFYVACIDTEQQLSPLNESFKADEYLTSIFHKDVYTNDRWLEILPKKATKATAVLELKKLLNCEKLIVFGDGKNDIPLFTAADESYAMQNAVPELKELATAVINSNDKDGVANWLKTNVL